MSDPDVEMFNRNLMKALVADNDRLRAEIERLRSVNVIDRTLCERLRDERDKAQAEIERLKAALRGVLAADAFSRKACIERMRAIARAALEGK